MQITQRWISEERLKMTVIIINQCICWFHKIASQKNKRKGRKIKGKQFWSFVERGTALMFYGLIKKRNWGNEQQEKRVTYIDRVGMKGSRRISKSRWLSGREGGACSHHHFLSCPFQLGGRCSYPHISSFFSYCFYSSMLCYARVQW